MTVGNQQTSAGQSAQPTKQEVWAMCVNEDRMTFDVLEDELVAALLSWAARQPDDGPVPAEHEPLCMKIDAFIDKVGCPHIHSDVLAKVQAEMYRRGVRYRFTDEAGAADGGAWVQVWLTDYLALGMPGTVTQLRRSRAWYRARVCDMDVRLRMAEAPLLRYAEGPTDPAKEAVLLADLRRVKLEQTRLEQAVAQMTAPQLEPEA